MAKQTKAPQDLNRDNRSRQLNPNNDAYWRARGKSDRQASQSRPKGKK